MRLWTGVWGLRPQRAGSRCASAMDARPGAQLLACLSVLLSPGAYAGPTWVSGVGTESCSHWTADQQAAVSEFALGYFTGANAIEAEAGKDGLTGSAMQSSGVLGLVTAECKQHPDEAIAVAVALTYHQLRRQGAGR